MNVEERKLLALATIVAPSVGLTQLKLKVQKEGEGGGGGEDGTVIIRQKNQLTYLHSV